MSVTLDAPCPELHVLVLDDDPVVRLAHTEMVRTLEPCARVTAVASVAEAIGAVKQFSGSQPVRVGCPRLRAGPTVSTTEVQEEAAQCDGRISSSSSDGEGARGGV